jgi:hypothetical protein
MIKRPKCRNCKGPLDIWHDPDTGITLSCNNLEGQHTPATTDKEFEERFNSLPGDDVVKLEKWYGPIRIES